MSTIDPILQNRTRRLVDLWQLYLSLDPLPQADRWLKQYGREARFGKQDRQFYSDQFFALCRAFHRHAAAVFIQRDNVTNPSDLERCVTMSMREWLSLLQGVDAAWFPPAIVGLSDVPQAVRVGLERLQEWRQIEPVGLAAALDAGLPPWGIAAWRHKILEKNFAARAFLDALPTRPPLWLRCQDSHRLHTVMRQLGADGVTILEQIGEAIAVSAPKSLKQHDLYLSGEIELQDYASQQIGQALLVQPGDLVWDVCAGGGGKTMQIASALQGKGLVLASDLRGYKLEEISLRAKRARFTVVQVKQHDATQELVLPERVKLHHGFDAVLVDAPCSSIGTWRRNPDGMLRSLEYETLKPLQQKILQQAAKSVRPGGRLVYATCSWAVEENERIVEHFLRENTAFRLADMHYAGSPETNADTTFYALCEKVETIKLPS